MMTYLGASGCFHGTPTADFLVGNGRLILLRFEYILSHESRYPELLTSLLLVRFNEDDGLKKIFPQETSPQGIYLLSSPEASHFHSEEFTTK